MEQRVTIAGLHIAAALADFVADEALVDLGLDAEHVWNGFAGILADLAPRNRALLETLVTKCRRGSTGWLRDQRGRPIDGSGLPGVSARDRLPGA